MNRKLNLFHFGDCGPYDQYNPLKLYNLPLIPELLYEIASGMPYQYNSYDLAKKLNEEHKPVENSLDQLIMLNMITNENDTYKINFTTFLSDDINHIKEFSNKIASDIGSLILKNKDELTSLVKKMTVNSSFKVDRILYHIIGDGIFDGKALEYFSQKGLFAISKPQVDNRDYILVGYEACEKIETFSKRLLCSSNNFRTSDYCFNSFGDGNGNRKDIYRFFRQNQVAINSATRHEELNETYNKLNDESNRALMKEVGSRLQSILGENGECKIDLYTEFMKEIGYVTYSNHDDLTLNVPVFKGNDLKIISQIEDRVLEMIDEPICNFFRSENDIQLTTPIKHKIPMKEIANELWHLVFGGINEYLIENGVFAKPEDIEGEGRYFKSVYIYE